MLTPSGKRGTATSAATATGGGRLDQGLEGDLGAHRTLMLPERHVHVGQLTLAAVLSPYLDLDGLADRRLERVMVVYAREAPDPLRPFAEAEDGPE